ncbi:MAG TPA: hypothetical protein VF695_11085 [Sphingomonas sp.]|jgi:hypothetical protein
MTRITQTGRDWTVTHRDHVATLRRVRNLPMARTPRFPAAEPPFPLRKALAGFAQLALWLAILGALAVLWGVTP